jgi:hypothetical protein
MTSLVVVTSDPAITVTQDNPAVTTVVPVTSQAQSKLGVSVSTPLAQTTDFNTVTTAGFYHTVDALSVNAPVAAQLWYLNVKVDGADPTSLIQTATTLIAPTTYIRVQVAGTFSAWQQEVLLDSLGRLPAVDGSQLTNINISAANQIENSISGLTISTAGGVSTFNVAAGAANDSTNVAAMVLPSALSKTTAAWSVGNGNGALDTGSIANFSWYYVFLIQRPDTGNVDVLFSLSLTPTLPTNYTLFRRIGAMLTDVNQHWTEFVQFGDEILWSTPVNDVNVTNLGAAATLFTVTVPPGLQVSARFRGHIASGTAGTIVLLNSPDETSTAANVPSGNRTGTVQVTGISAALGELMIRTSTSAQIRAVANASSTTLVLTTFGWIDRRGKV